MASFIKKIVKARSKSRSKSPVKQQHQQANHHHIFGGGIDDDGWRISSERSPSPPKTSTSAKMENIIEESWNPAMGRFKSSKRVSSTKDAGSGGLGRPSGYLTPDGVVCDGQIPSSSASTELMIHESLHEHYDQLPLRHQPQSAYRSPQKLNIAPSSHLKHNSITPLTSPTQTILSQELSGYYSSIPPQTLIRSESPSKNRLFEKHNQTQSNHVTKGQLLGVERQKQPAEDVWFGGTFLRTSASNPEGSLALESRQQSMSDGKTTQNSLRSQDYTTPKDPFFTADPYTITAEHRARSISPRKQPTQPKADDRPFRSRSPAKKAQRGLKSFDYLQSECKLEGCSAAIIVEGSKFLVCRHQLSHASDFFRTLFVVDNRALPLEGVRQISPNEYSLIVSSLRHPPQNQQFQWFIGILVLSTGILSLNTIECTIPCPMLRDISEEFLETCMRLSKRFQAKGLELRCAKFIQENVEQKSPIMALCWLNWTFKHRFERSVRMRCLPVVARLPLAQLEKYRQMMPENIYSDILATKLRTTYSQTATVFRSIHRMDHFFVDLDRCPRCGRQREQGKTNREDFSKLVGCERCMVEFGCEVEQNSGSEFQAYYRCDHGLWAFGDKTEDCQCQTLLYKEALSSGSSNQPITIRKKGELETNTSKAPTDRLSSMREKVIKRLPQDATTAYSRQNSNWYQFNDDRKREF